MKSVSTFIFAAILFAVSIAQAGPAVSGGSSPFIYSASAMEIIFQSPLIWRKVFGSIDRVLRVDQNQKSVTFQIATTESVPVKNERGSTTGYTQQPCEFRATVSNVSTDIIPRLEVTNVDFSRCPSANQ